jgi:hypothetical protein
MRTVVGSPGSDIVLRMEPGAPTTSGSCAIDTRRPASSSGSAGPDRRRGPWLHLEIWAASRVSRPWVPRAVIMYCLSEAIVFAYDHGVVTPGPTA